MSLSPLQSHQSAIFVSKIELVARNLAVMTAFYSDVVGLDVISTAPDATSLGCGNSILVQIKHVSHVQLRNEGMPGLFHTAFLLPTRNHLGAWLRHAMKNQIPLEGLSDHLVSEAAYLSDPEGNGIEIYADRPQNTWNIPGQPIKMGTSRMDVEAVLAAAVQPEAGTYKMPSTTRIGHVHLSVGELAEAGRLLSDVIGMRKKASYPQADFYASGDYHHHVAINTWHSGEHKTYRGGYTGLERVTLQVPDLLERQALALRLLKAGGQENDAKITFVGPAAIPFALDLSDANVN